MKSGQFVVGMLNGNNESYESPNLQTLISPEALAELWELAKTRGKGTYNYFDPKERIIAHTVITESLPDEMGRKGLINHTVIFKFEPNYLLDIIAHTDFKQHFNVAMPQLRNPLPRPPIRKTQQ